MRRVAVLVGVALLATACSTQELGVDQPRCDIEDPESGSALLLAAQSVPGEFIPCITELPPGWEFDYFEARTGLARFVLDSDRYGRGFLKVDLRDECDVGAAEEVPTDQEGTRRLVDVEADDETYRGTWTYLFTGGCVQYRFNAAGPEINALPLDASATILFTPRSTYQDAVSDEFGYTVD